MIVWLASYPRSGNTLFRTILKHCFDMCSYVDEPTHGDSEFRNNPELIGHVELNEEWDKFYKDATESPETILVKTHLPPCDDQPFIYIVRDGRASVSSYRRFHKVVNGVEKSLPGLMVGDDAYGDWSSHYKCWNDRAGMRKLVLRFEELVDISESDLQRVAGFLNFGGKIDAWVNPIKKLSSIEPRFFNNGEPFFQQKEDWSSSMEYLFERLHGHLMRTLGYYGKDRNDEHTVRVLQDSAGLIGDLLHLIDSLLEQRSELQNVCDDRLAVINKLQRICEERLAVIERVHKP